MLFDWELLEIRLAEEDCCKEEEEEKGNKEQCIEDEEEVEEFYFEYEEGWEEEEDKGEEDVRVIGIDCIDPPYIITAPENGLAKVWSIENESCIKTFQTSSGRARLKSVAVSPDGVSVLTIVSQPFAMIWNIASGKCTNSLFGHTDDVSSGEFSANGSLVLTGSYDGTAKLWCTEGGSYMESFRAFKGWAVFSKDGASVLIACSDRVARLWSVEHRAFVQEFEGHTEYVSSAVLSADNTLVLTTSLDCTARLWATDSGTCSMIFTGHTERVNSAAFSANSTAILTTSSDGKAKVWSTATGLCTRTFSCKNDANLGQSTVMFSVDCASVLIATHGCVEIWSVETGVCFQSVVVAVGDTGCVKSVDLSADGAFALIASSDGAASLWSIAKSCVFTATISTGADHVQVSITNLAGCLLHVFQISHAQANIGALAAVFRNRHMPEVASLCFFTNDGSQVDGADLLHSHGRLTMHAMAAARCVMTVGGNGTLASAVLYEGCGHSVSAVTGINC